MKLSDDLYKKELKKRKNPIVKIDKTLSDLDNETLFPEKYWITKTMDESDSVKHHS